MSTRCLIGKENKDKSITYIYVHHDGYLSWAGKILIDNYKDETKIDKLLSLGDLSDLGTEPVSAKDFEGTLEDFCTPYSLRGENCPAQTVKNVNKYLEVKAGQSYFYLFRNGEWYVLESWNTAEPNWQLVNVRLNK